jgi:hypothetical protein
MFLVRHHEAEGDPSNKPIDRPPARIGGILRVSVFKMGVLRWYLGARFDRWCTLEAIDINAGDDVEVGLSGQDRGIRKLQRACRYGS